MCTVQSNPYLYPTVDKQFLHGFAIALVQTGVVKADTEGECEFEVAVANPSDNVLHLRESGKKK